MTQRNTAYDNSIAELYATNITTKQVADKLGLHTSFVRRALRGLGLNKRAGNPAPGKLEAHYEAIKRDYDAGVSITNMCHTYDCDYVTLRKFTEKYNFVKRTSWCRNPKGKLLSSMTPEQEQEVLTDYSTHQFTLKQLHAKYGWAAPVIRKVLIKHNVPRRPAHTRPKSPAEKRTAYLQRNYGITAADYDAMLAKQDGRCAICGCTPTELGHAKTIALAVDHDHVTGKVRGLLCLNCNQSLGGFSDRPEVVRKAVEYLAGNQPSVPTQPNAIEATTITV